MRPEAKASVKEKEDIRPAVRAFLAELVEFQRGAAMPSQLGKDMVADIVRAGQMPRKHGKDRALYDKLTWIRQLYKGAKQPPLTADEGRHLTRFPGIFGDTALGVVERHGLDVYGELAGWRWTFEPAGYDVHGDDFESEEEARAELWLLQSRLYPDWEEEGERPQHLERLLYLLRCFHSGAGRYVRSSVAVCEAAAQQRRSAKQRVAAKESLEKASGSAEPRDCHGHSVGCSLGGRFAR